MWNSFNESVFYSLSEQQGIVAHDLRTNQTKKSSLKNSFEYLTDYYLDEKIIVLSDINNSIVQYDFLNDLIVKQSEQISL